MGLQCTGFGHAARGDWHPGRATYFDAPQYWKDAFQPGKFGDLYGSACQYVDRREGVTPTNADVPLPLDGVGAVTSVMSYNTGECARLRRCMSFVATESTYISEVIVVE